MRSLRRISRLKYSGHWLTMAVFLVRRKTDGWRMLGGVLLAFTGVEALFADLGAFSRRAIQLSWFGYAFPCLLLAYTGQAAFIARHQGAYLNPFYSAAPPGMRYPSLIVAILAAIVASQVCNSRNKFPSQDRLAGSGKRRLPSYTCLFLTYT